MDVNFCVNYIGDGSKGTRQYCRECLKSSIACNNLWQMVVNLAESNGENGVLFKRKRGKDFVLLPPRKDRSIARLKVNVNWPLYKQDFLHFVSTGSSKGGYQDEFKDPTKSPSLAFNESYIRAIVEHIGGMDIPEIKKVRKVQRG
jgi:hypothetical protein